MNIKTTVIPLLICLITFGGCSLLHFLTVNDKRPPETHAVYNAFLNNLHIDTTDSFQISGKYYDSLSSTRYALNTYKLKHDGKASPVQIRMYNSKNKLVNGYEQCFGDLSKLGMMDSVPMKKLSWLPVNYDLTLKNDLALLNVSPVCKQTILKECKNYDYTILVFYTKWAGWYSKNTVTMVKHYILQNKKYRFLFIKVNTSPMH